MLSFLIFQMGRVVEPISKGGYGNDIILCTMLRNDAGYAFSTCKLVILFQFIRHQLYIKDHHSYPSHLIGYENKKKNCACPSPCPHQPSLESWWEHTPILTFPEACPQAGHTEDSSKQYLWSLNEKIRCLFSVTSFTTFIIFEHLVCNFL